jgi:hypothetical protein
MKAAEMVRLRTVLPVPGSMRNTRPGPLESGTNRAQIDRALAAMKISDAVWEVSGVGEPAVRVEGSILRIVAGSEESATHTDPSAASMSRVWP